ncbi:tRNA pseudouridine(38-40) synthase TruA [Candidatus Dependentiae bacterium]|nr:tRNA pseudouridine(38-40) synthase TruA [Candidatus Dependentiae bacterium]
MQKEKTYKIIVAYDGTNYCGWQRQPQVSTVVGVLEQRFQAVFKTEIALLGASRTDAGVHALGQVARFRTTLSIGIEQLKNAWNNVLPADIIIRELTQVEDTFNPQHNVAQKTYYYHFFQRRPLPFVYRYGAYYKPTIDLEKLTECLNVFVGTHDFRSFCTGQDKENTIRTIHSITVNSFKKYGFYRITIKGPGFLRYMIRRIVGACLDSACTPELTKEHLITALAEKNPSQKFDTAPARGLILRKIVYK